MTVSYERIRLSYMCHDCLISAEHEKTQRLQEERVHHYAQLHSEVPLCEETSA